MYGNSGKFFQCKISLENLSPETSLPMENFHHRKIPNTKKFSLFSLQKHQKQEEQ